MESDKITGDRKNHTLEHSTIQNTTKKNEIRRNEKERVNINQMSCKTNQTKDIKKINSISQIPSSNSSSKEYITSHPRNAIEGPDTSHELNKVHKLSRSPAKKKHKYVNKVTKIETHKSDSFYTGAIVGSFLGAAISGAITKFLTETT